MLSMKQQLLFTNFQDRAIQLKKIIMIQCLYCYTKGLSGLVTKTSYGTIFFLNYY